MRERMTVLTACLVVVIGTSCLAVADLSRHTCGDACDDGRDAATSDVVGDASSPVSGRCPSGRGPAMISVGSFCIDTTEVTQAQYAEFLKEAASFDAGPPLPLCGAGGPLLPTCKEYDPGRSPAHPVSCITWCAARTFCQWAGKRLCGRVGGGTLAVEAARDPASSEWMAACTRGGERSWPYGVSFEVGACALALNESVPVASTLTCEGGYEGLFDMVGNVEEWEDACTSYEEGGHCLKRGLDAFSIPEARCAAAFPEAVDEATADTGFRCCAALDPSRD